MAKSRLTLTDEGVERLAQALQNYDGYAGNAINEVLWSEGGVLIKEGIMPLLPVSGRTWKGKKPAAKSTDPFMQMNDTLSVAIKTKNAYHYLYFPDDGSTTRKHVGNRQFMLGGAEAKQDEIIDRCIAKLTENFR